MGIESNNMWSCECLLRAWKSDRQTECCVVWSRKGKKRPLTLWPMIIQIGPVGGLRRQHGVLTLPRHFMRVEADQINWEQRLAGTGPVRSKGHSSSVNRLRSLTGT